MPTATTKKPIDLAAFGREVEAGLTNERPTMDAALERQAFFDYSGERYEKRFRRDAESSFDYQGRPHRPSGFLRQCIEILCEHSYCPGPIRAWDDKAGDAFLERVRQDNLLDALMGCAETLSTLNGCAAIQIDPGEGVFDERPITYRLWGREQFAAWPSADNPREPAVVCTVDRYDLRTRYRLWSDTEVWTYLTKRADGTSGGTAAYLDSKQEHGYGCLPFTFVSYELPVRDFDVSCAGEFLHKAEVRIDNRLNLLDESIAKHLNPVPVAEGVDAQWKPTVEPMRFIRMPLAAPAMGPNGYERGEYARLYFLQPQVDVAGAWQDQIGYINQALRAARVPISATLIDEAPGVISGIALILAEAPLFKRARRRHGIFGVYEQDLARRTLTVAGRHYGLDALAASAKSGRLTLGWPQPSIPVPTPDALELLTQEVAGGFKSHLMAVQQWLHLDRRGALAYLEQVKEDNEAVAKILGVNPAPAATPKAIGTEEPATPDPGPEGGEEEASGRLEDDVDFPNE